MNFLFVRPQHTSHNNGNFVAATKAGGLYGMDVEGGSENMLSELVLRLRRRQCETRPAPEEGQERH